MRKKHIKLAVYEGVAIGVQSEKVKKLYSIFGARWYDPFKKIWNSLTARRAEKDLKSFLKENIHQDSSILELGCGTAMNLEKIFALGLNFKKYIGIDFSPDMLKIAEKKFSNKKNIKFMRRDITKLDDIKEKFDIVICTWVLSHLKHPSDFANYAQKFISETLPRLARPRRGKNGKMLIIFFSRPKWYLRFWFSPIAKLVFSAKTISDDEIRLIKNIKSIRKYFGDMVTVMNI